MDALEILNAWMKSHRERPHDGEIVWRVFGEGPMDINQLVIASYDPDESPLHWTDAEGISCSMPAPTKDVLLAALTTRFSRVYPAMAICNTMGGRRSTKWTLIHLVPWGVLLEHADCRGIDLAEHPVSPVEEGIAKVGDSPLYVKWRGQTCGA